jgi:hypothetical protein
MIRKPDTAWGREDDRLVETARQFGGPASTTASAAVSGIRRARYGYNAVAAGVVAATTGCAAVKAGVLGTNFPMAAGIGGVSLLAGCLAVWNFRKAFGGAPRPAAAQNWASQNSASENWASQAYDPAGMRAAGAAGWDARATEMGQAQGLPSGGRTVISYDRAKILGSAAGLACVCLFLAVILTGALHVRTNPMLSAMHPGAIARPHNSPLMVLLFLVALGYYVWQTFGYVLRGTDKDLTAVSWDSRQIKVRTLVWSRQVPWSAFESISLKRKTLRLFRMIPVHTSYALVFRLRHNGASRLMQIPASELTVAKSALPELMRNIELCHARYVCSTFGGGDQPAAEYGQRMDPPWPAAEPAHRAQAFGTQAPSAFGRKAG